MWFEKVTRSEIGKLPRIAILAGGSVLVLCWASLRAEINDAEPRTTTPKTTEIVMPPEIAKLAEIKTSLEQNANVDRGVIKALEDAVAATRTLVEERQKEVRTLKASITEKMEDLDSLGRKIASLREQQEQFHRLHSKETKELAELTKSVLEKPSKNAPLTAPASLVFLGYQKRTLEGNLVAAGLELRAANRDLLGLQMQKDPKIATDEAFAKADTRVATAKMKLGEIQAEIEHVARTVTFVQQENNQRLKAKPNGTRP